MSILSAILKPFGYVRSTSGTRNPAQWLIDWVSGGGPTASGLNVTEQSALKYTPFWAAVRVISGTVASLPFHVYKRLANGGKERAAGHPLYTLLHDRPNEYMDALTFIESRQAHVLTYGNGFAEIQRDGGGRPVALWPLLPDRVTRRLDAQKTPYYEVRLPNGGIANLPDYNILHIKGLGFDGYTGYDVVSYHKEAIAYGMAVKEYGARFFGNSAYPGGVLEHPKQVGDVEKLRKSWHLESGGIEKAHRIRILEEGMTWKPTGVEPERAQALEVQKYTVDDCSRIFNIPPHKLGSMERATFSNIEEQNIDFVTQTMFYWFRKWEQEVNHKLIMPGDRRTYFAEILVDALLRGNMEARTKSYATGRQWGYLSINDIRRKENMNPIGDEGDIYLDPMNMKPAGTEINITQGAGAISEAHRELIEAQWKRIITKQIGALQKHRNDDCYDGIRSFAARIMFGPANAYATTIGKAETETRSALQHVIGVYINRHTPLDIEDAEWLTETVIDQIGKGDNGNGTPKQKDN